MTDIEYDFLSPGDTIINEGSISRNLPAELQIPNLVVHIRDIDGSFATLVFNEGNNCLFFNGKLQEIQ